MGMTPFEEAVIDRIKSGMKTRHATQTELAEALHVKQYSISRMLNGAPFPTLEQLVEIAKFLDMSLYYLIGIQEESYRELSKDGAKVADAYQRSDEVTKTIIRRVLMIQ